MLRIIGAIAIFIGLAVFPEQIKAGVDVGSCVCKVIWVMGEGMGRYANHLYNKDIAPVVDEAKKVDVTKP